MTDLRFLLMLNMLLIAANINALCIWGLYLSVTNSMAKSVYTYFHFVINLNAMYCMSEVITFKMVEKQT